MLELEGIHFHPATAEKKILNGLSLKAYAGLPIIIGGSSGSGKTSLIEVISGLAKPQSGRITWFEKHLSERQRRMLSGVVFQFPERHFLGLTVGQELRLGHKRLSGEDQSEALFKVGLSEVNIKSAPEKLSGGQQRRLAIAVQLLRKPSILLLDEPTAGLDWSVRDEIINLLANLSRNQVLVIVTHEPELFRKWVKSTYQLKNGKLIK